MSRSGPTISRIDSRALKISIPFVIFGLIWVAGTDLLLHQVIKVPGRHGLVPLFVGSLFVMAAAVVVYKYSRRSFSEQDRLAAQLQESEEHYRMVVEQQTELISRYRPDGAYVFVNEVFCRFFGKTREEILGQPWQPDAVAEDLPMIEGLLQTLSPAHPVVTIENRVYSANREVRWMQFVNRGFFDKDGQLYETQAVGRDITERKRLEEDLRRGEEENRAIISAVPDLLFRIDRNGTIMDYRGQPAPDISGAPKAFVGRKMDNVFPSPAMDRIAGAVEQVFDTQQMVTVEYQMQMLDQPAFFEGRIVALSEQEVLCLVRDITNRKQAEESLRTYAVWLIELEERMRKDLATELHDQLGRDISVLGLHFSALINDLSSEARGKTGERLEYCGNLIRDLGSSVRSIMAELRPPMIDDYGLPAALLWFGELQAKRSGFQFSLQAEKSFPRMVNEKELALFRIFQEALVNAGKYAAAEKVTATLSHHDGVIRLSIADNGKGFDPAMSLEDTETSHWGLKIMRDRAMTVGAVFELHSAPGQGTLIAVELKEKP
ncbi:MAG: PAS domain S-box protein [Nitrospirae bacterium]|nr:PAS domain S-box protein [Nitrospirota bacterium]